MEIQPSSSSPLFNPSEKAHKPPTDRIYERLYDIITFINPPQDPLWPLMKNEAKEALDHLIQDILDSHKILMYFGEKEGKEFATNLQGILEQIDNNPDPWELGKSLSDACAKAFERASPGFSQLFVANSVVYNEHVTSENFDQAIAILESAQKITPPLTEIQVLTLKDLIDEIQACKEGKGDFTSLLYSISISGADAFLLNR